MIYQKLRQKQKVNMPFELGIDYGIKSINNDIMSKKQFLILESVKYDYMKALSDINGFDTKVHENNTIKIFECLYAWISETLKIKGQNPPKQIFYEYTDFNTNLYEDKLKEFDSDKFHSKKIDSEECATNYIENISITEYIQEIKDRIL